MSVSLPPGLRFVERQEWGACEPKSVKQVKHPMEHVCFSYNIGTTPCHGDEECFKVLQQAQQDFMANGLPDIPYNFLVGGDGTIYEGRGWNAQSSSCLGRSTSPRLDIAFIGDFERKTLPKNMYFNGIDWVYHAVRENFLMKQYSFQESRYAPRIHPAVRTKANIDWLLNR